MATTGRDSGVVVHCLDNRGHCFLLGDWRLLVGGDLASGNLYPLRCCIRIFHPLFPKRNWGVSCIGLARIISFLRHGRTSLRICFRLPCPYIHHCPDPWEYWPVEERADISGDFNNNEEALGQTFVRVAEDEERMPGKQPIGLGQGQA